MKFQSSEVQRCVDLFHTVGFNQAGSELRTVLGTATDPVERLEAQCLSLRINLDQDDPEAMKRIHRDAQRLVESAVKHVVEGVAVA